MCCNLRRVSLCVVLLLVVIASIPCEAQDRTRRTAPVKRGSANQDPNQSPLVVTRGKATSWKLRGEAIEQARSVRVTDGKRPVSGVTVKLGRAARDGRTFTLSASRSARMGVDFELWADLGESKSEKLPNPVHVVDSEAAVERDVRATNLRIRSAPRTIQRGGWRMTKAEQPDSKIVSLDPAAAPRAAVEQMKRHLASNSFAGDQLKAVERLAVETKDESLRAAALTAIARSPDKDSSRVLRRLERSLPRRGTTTQLMQRETAVQMSRRDLSRLTKEGLHQHGTRELTARFGSRLETPELRLSNQLQQIIRLRENQKNSPHVLTFKVDSDGVLTTPPSSELNNPGDYRQILILPTGYETDDYQTFRDDASHMISLMGNLPETVYTSKYRDKIIYVVYWLPGQTLDSGNANFGAALFEHPTRPGTLGLTLVPDRVHDDGVLGAKSLLSSTDPIGVIVVYNHSDEDSTASALFPHWNGRPYGIARFERGDLYGSRPDYIAMHELAHAALQFMDEYIEASLAGVNITSLDVLSPTLVASGSWASYFNSLEDLVGQYDWRFSDLFADNGSDNISTRSTPATVDTPNYSEQTFEHEGGMFFSHGTFHHDGNNVMNGSRISASSPLLPDGDRFDYDHSDSQLNTLETIFDSPHQAQRPNNRLRNSGPLLEWAPQWGNSVRVMLHDGDKNHRWHPTLEYEVQLSWSAVQAKTCSRQVTYFDVSSGSWKTETVYYPCGTETVEYTATTSVEPTQRFVDLKQSLLSGGATALRAVLLALGVVELPLGSNQDEVFNLGEHSVDDLTSSAMPSVLWPSPYQDVQVEAPLPFTTYYWRFRAKNSWGWSGWTSWAQFYRTL